MVERILDAGRRVLIERGYDGATTNRIAEVAGISPGSLYQYFPNKDAIISAIIDSYSDDVVRTVMTSVLEQFGRPEDIQTLREVLAALLDAMNAQPELLRALIEHTPRLGLGSKIADFEQRVGELAIAHMRMRTQPTQHADTRVWIAVRAVEHLTVRYVLDRPAIDHDEFLDELCALMGSYIALRGHRVDPNGDTNL